MKIMISICVHSYISFSNKDGLEGVNLAVGTILLVILISIAIDTR